MKIIIVVVVVVVVKVVVVAFSGHRDTRIPDTGTQGGIKLL